MRKRKIPGLVNPHSEAFQANLTPPVPTNSNMRMELADVEMVITTEKGEIRHIRWADKKNNVIGIDLYKEDLNG